MASHTSLIKYIVFMFVIWTTCSAMQTIYLADFCNKEYTVYKDVKIKIMRTWYMSDNYDCSMTLTVSTGSRLKARFDSYKQGDYSLFDHCKKQAIYLNNYFKPEGYCSAFKPSDNYDLGTRGTYRYRVNGDSSIFSITVAKADLIVTEVTDKTGDSCPSGFFDCEKDNTCIDNDLKCNDYDDCGNNRDEIEGCGLTTGIIVGIVFGVIGFIAIVAIIVLLVIKCK